MVCLGLRQLTEDIILVVNAISSVDNITVNGLTSPFYIRGGGVLPYICYTGMCRWRGYGFQAIWSGKGYGFQAIWSGKGYGFQAIWSSIGSRLTGSLTKD